MSTTTTTTSTHTTLKAEPDSTASPSTTVAANSTHPTKDSASSEPQQKKESEEEEPDIYDEVEIEDMTYDSTLQIYHYPCPCGDRFEIAIASLRDGEDIAVCPGCSLTIRVIFDEADLEKEGG